jgi:hypothetical protein
VPSSRPPASAPAAMRSASAGAGAPVALRGPRCARAPSGKACRRPSRPPVDGRVPPARARSLPSPCGTPVAAPRPPPRAAPHRRTRPFLPCQTPAAALSPLPALFAPPAAPRPSAGPSSSPALVRWQWQGSWKGRRGVGSADGAPQRRAERGTESDRDETSWTHLVSGAVLSALARASDVLFSLFVSLCFT